MAYKKQNFYTNQTLKAEHLNNIEAGIVANEAAIAEKQPLGNYATEEFVTSKISEASINGGDSNVDLSIYATKTEVADGYQPKGEYLTEHQPIKTINGQSLVGNGDIEIQRARSRICPLKDGEHDVLAINHRGYSKEAPENTIPAYILSKQKGYNYVECDVSFTADGVAVLLHDETIDRTSDGSGNISQLTYQQILQYDFGSWFSTKYTGTKIPTFSEFIRYCKGLGLHPYIELKSNGGYTSEQIGQIVNEVELCGMKGRVTYISFSSTFLRYVKEHDVQARLGYIANITSSTIAEAVALKTGENEVFMDVNYTYITDSKILSCAENDLPVEVWTVNQASVIKELHPYITGVTSDNQHAGNILHEKYSTYTYSEDTGDSPAEVEVTAITSNTGNNTATLEKGSTVQLGVTYTPSDTTQTGVYWTTSSESVARVSNTGVVTGVTTGNATITATSTYNSSLKVVWTITVSDSTGGGDAGDGDDTGDTTPTMYTVTNNLTNVTNSNSNTSVENGSSYTANISALDGYTILRTTITMGGNDITSSVYSDGVISIDSVNGDVVITIVASNGSYDVVRTITQDELSVGKQIASSGSPYYNDNKARTSYLDFDLAYEEGYTYKFEFTTGGGLECSIGTQWYNQTGKKNQESGAVIGTSNVYDPGWKANGIEITPPEKHNGSAIVGYRFTFKRNDNSTMVDGDITSVTISRKMTE